MKGHCDPSSSALSTFSHCPSAWVCPWVSVEKGLSPGFKKSVMVLKNVQILYMCYSHLLCLTFFSWLFKPPDPNSTKQRIGWLKSQHNRTMWRVLGWQLNILLQMGPWQTHSTWVQRGVSSCCSHLAGRQNAFYNHTVIHAECILIGLPRYNVIQH